MLVRDFKRLVLCAGPFLVLFYLGVNLFRHPEAVQRRLGSWVQPTQASLGDVNSPKEGAVPSDTGPDLPEDGSASESKEAATIGSQSDHELGLESAESSHQEVFALSTEDKKFFLIDFGQMHAMNPNVIPHPTLENTWAIVAQQANAKQSSIFTELVCNATFKDGALRCLEPPTALPIAATTGNLCKGDLEYFNDVAGPHDARVANGPRGPYAVYGSNSMFTCFGQFVQDFSTLVNWNVDTLGLEDFRVGTELQRPLPWGTIEKNWFLFWDPDGQAYVHYNIVPNRVFAKINPDGSAGPDLSPSAVASDGRCFAKYMPKLASELESIHQATNSLQITMCRRSDPACTMDDSNTFLFTIYQHKTYYGFHSVYEPYVMLFQQRAPFEIHAMSRQPLWIHGRERHPERNTSDMFYVTSMSWKRQSQRYHGYLDDELFISFGIEDERAGGIDLLAEHLLEGLGLCDES